ncbi:stearoyl-[acyl-carrier-protein] 9-desaturase 6, chloroplastic-like [Malus domestica]|uniref:stearoyl-[acyl-carrier-protein] 9-desaturase 6, chloroplastic-like n=1 Tax=Malus domestica TaxID=3750 RepID=UPI000498D4F1
MKPSQPHHCPPWICKTQETPVTPSENSPSSSSLSINLFDNPYPLPDPHHHQVQILPDIDWISVLSGDQPPSTFLTDSSLLEEKFLGQVRAFRDRTSKLPDEYFVALVRDMITRDALLTYQTMVNGLDEVKDETGSSPSTWA